MENTVESTAENTDEKLEGCLCEYIRVDYRERLERFIEANGGGEPGSNCSFVNVAIQVNDALKNHLSVLEGTGAKRKPRKGKLSGTGI